MSEECRFTAFCAAQLLAGAPPPPAGCRDSTHRLPTLCFEQVRTMAVTLAQDGKSVKVCVQEAMGAGVFQGLPLSLSGVKRYAVPSHCYRFMTSSLIVTVVAVCV